MKEDFLRLLSAAMEYYPEKVKTPADLGRVLNESDQTMHNWSKRGLPKTKVFDLAMKFGCNGVWVRDGTGPKSAKSLQIVQDAIAETASPAPVQGTDAKPSQISSGVIITGATAQSATQTSNPPAFGAYRFRPAEVESIHATINTLSDNGALDKEAIAALAALLQLIETKNN